MTRIVPMSAVALRRTTGKPGIGGSRTLVTAPIRPTCRTSKPRGTDHRDLPHRGVHHDLDVPVVELGFGQINGDRRHACMDRRNTTYLPATLEANLSHRG